MAQPLTAPLIARELFVYGGFMGMDRSRHVASMDTGENQYLWTVNNAFADWQGNLSRMGQFRPRFVSPRKLIEHVAFYAPNRLAWAQRDGTKITLSADNGVYKPDAYDASSIVTSALFNRKLVVAADNSPMYIYDGLKWQQHPSENDGHPSFLATVSTRLVMAGMPGARSEIWFSRADDHEVMPDDESETEVRVTRAAKINIANVLGRAEEIRGIGRLENDRLCVFGEDQVLVYKITSDLNEWGLEDRTAIQVGTVAHNSIVNAGNQVIFAARDGIYTVSRSAQNGITINSLNLSPRVTTLYRSLIAQMKNPQRLSACFDRDTMQYHLFFPITDDISQALTLTISPVSDIENKFSTFDFFAPRCGASVGGTTSFGTSKGIYDLRWWSDEADREAFTPPLYIKTPILWLGPSDTQKATSTFSLQARGKGYVILDIKDDEDRPLQSFRFKLDADEADDNFPDLPLFQQHVRKFEHRIRGVQVEIYAEGDGLCQINAFAFRIRKPGG